MPTPEDLKDLNDDLGLRPSWYSLGYSATHFFVEPASAVARHMIERSMETLKAERAYDTAFALNGSYLLREKDLAFAQARQTVAERIANGIFERHTQQKATDTNYPGYAGLVTGICDSESSRVIFAEDHIYTHEQRVTLLRDIQWLGLMFMLEDDHFRPALTPRPQLGR